MKDGAKSIMQNQLSREDHTIDYAKSPLYQYLKISQSLEFNFSYYPLTADYLCNILVMLQTMYK
jgi:hypothetical protein